MLCGEYPFTGQLFPSMSYHARELRLPDGTVIEGGMGTAGMIITDKLVDEKTHIYDDETHGDGKGRNASSQLAWHLQEVPPQLPALGLS